MIGSYPNLFFDIHQDDIPDFINLIHSLMLAKQAWPGWRNTGLIVQMTDFGNYDCFRKGLTRMNCSEGMLDLNRYFHKAKIETVDSRRFLCLLDGFHA